MDNVITEKRGLIIILVVATVLLFVGLVWGIATYIPLNLDGIPSPSSTDAELLAAKNCTYPAEYWREHPEAYPAQLVIGGQVYKENDLKAILAGETQDISAQLQAQLVTAYLNFISGADQRTVETTLFEANGWLVRHPEGTELADSDGEAGNRLINILIAYNMGLAGVPACVPGLASTSTGTSNASLTATISFTITPSQTLTLTPSETPTPLGYPTEPVYTVVVPTRTLIATTSVPNPPTSTPPQPTQPPATDTPVPPTEPPPATRTLPAATSTFTQPPLPSDTYTPPPVHTPTP